MTTQIISAADYLEADPDAAAEPIAEDAEDQRPSNDRELLQWVETALGRHVPRVATCEGHNAPADFICDAFFGRVTDALVLANRSGGKTEDFAILHTANGRWKPGHETSHFGAIKIQARRCYTYFRRFTRRPKVAPHIESGKVETTDWSNGSTIEILPATEAQTQGGHPDLTSFDELEQGKFQPYENAKAMPEEYIDPETGRRTVGQFIAGSTRVSGLGLMQAAIDEAEEKGTPVYSWCIFETMQPCDGKDGRPGCIGRACPLARWCIGGGDEVEHHCDLDDEIGLHGRVVHADGWRSYQQAIAVFSRAGVDTWEAQHLSRKPESSALIYAVFDAVNVTEDAVYVPGMGRLLVAYDWGYTDNTWIGLLQERDGVRPDGTVGLAWYLFKEFTGNQTPESDWVTEVTRYLCALPNYDGPSFEQWERIWRGLDDWPAPWPEVWPEVIAGDPSAVQLRSEFRNRGFTVRHPARVKHEVTTGQSVLRAIMLSGGGRRLFVSRAGAPKFIEAAGRYRAKRNDDGTYSDKPDPEAANHRFSHPLDGLRYLGFAERARFGIEVAVTEAELAAEADDDED